MPKQSLRQKIVDAGLLVVMEQGYCGASVRDVVRAAGVPQGSFTNHFASKEAFGLEVIDLYLTNSRAVMRDTLLNDALAPLQRLGAYIDAGMNRLNKDSMRNGCLFGNFTAEACDQSESMRQKLLDVFAEVRRSVAYCLKAAVDAGELRPDFDCDEVAAFIVSSLQGANLLAKAERSPAPVERLKRMLFSTILR